MNRILVTPRSLTRTPDPALQRLAEHGYEIVFSQPGETPDEAALLRLLPGCVGWLAGVEPVSPRVLEAAPGLRAISRNGIGADNLPLEVAQRLGIQVLRAAGANARGVAELAIELLPAALRHVPEQSAALKAGSWQRRPGLESRTLGLVGCGVIGRLVARFALALDAHVRVFDPYPDAGFTPPGDFAWVSFAAVLAEAEMLSLHCPMPADRRPVLDAASLERLRPGCHVINTMTSLDWARSQLDHQAVGKAIDLLAAAKRIEFFGFGASWIVAADAQQKFPLSGVPCLVHTDSTSGSSRPP